MKTDRAKPAFFFDTNGKGFFDANGKGFFDTTPKAGFASIFVQLVALLLPQGPLTFQGRAPTPASPGLPLLSQPESVIAPEP